MPFGVSSVAQDAAVASLRGRGRAAASGSERWSRSGPGCSDALRDQGWTRCPTSQANFVWLRLGERTADFAAACEAAGVVVRPFAGEGARVTVGEPEANDLFLQVAEDFAG